MHEDSYGPAALSQLNFSGHSSSIPQFLESLNTVVLQFERRMLEMSNNCCFSHHTTCDDIFGGSSAPSSKLERTSCQSVGLNESTCAGSSVLEFQKEIDELDAFINNIQWLQSKEEILFKGVDGSQDTATKNKAVVDSCEGECKVYNRLPVPIIIHILSMISINVHSGEVTGSTRSSRASSLLVGFGYFNHDKQRIVYRVFPHVEYGTADRWNDKTESSDGLFVSKTDTMTTHDEMLDCQEQSEESCSERKPEDESHCSSGIDDQQFCSILASCSSKGLNCSYNIISSPKPPSINTHIRRLIIQYNDITDTGVHAICTKLPHLSHLDLSCTNVTDRCARYFSALSKLKTLILNKNQTLTDEALRAICTGENFHLMEHLAMRGCSVGDRGIRSLTYTLMTGENQIRTIDLSENNIGDEGLERFLLFMCGRQSHCPQFKWLSLQDNSTLTKHGRSSLALYYQTCHTRVYLKHLLHVEKVLLLIKQLLNMWQYKRSRKTFK